MEKLSIVCAACGARLRVPADQAGSKGKCPRCAAEVLVPGQAVPGAAASSAPPAVPALESDEASASPAPSTLDTTARETPLETTPSEPPPLFGKSLVAATLAAGLGAVAWAALLVVTEYEIGWLAWGVGGLVGFVAVRTGARGVAHAGAAAALSVLAIFAGKCLGLHLVASRELERALRATAQEQMTEIQRDAADWVTLTAAGDPGDAAVREFMVSHAYTEPGADVADEAVAYFREQSAPNLEWFHAEQPTPDEFVDHSLDDARDLLYVEESLVSIVIANLAPLDLLFAFLGVSTAWGLVKKAGAPVRSGAASAS